MDVVIGAGMGGLAAAIRLARRGREVTVLEARERVGGLASGVDVGEYHDDGGPYILLDRPGLEWAFTELGVDLGSVLDLIPLDEIYRVRRPDAPTFHLRRSLEETVAGLEASWPGSGRKYEVYVQRMIGIYERLRPLQSEARPGPLLLLRHGLIREGLFLLRGLEHHLRKAGLPDPVVDALGIWTHIAGQPLSHAPAPMAFVPAIVHQWGSYVVRGGIRKIPEALEKVARDLGVQFRTGAPVERIVHADGRILGVEVGGERLATRRVISDIGLGTYLKLLDPPDPASTRWLQALPLQSPGVAAWMRVEADASVPFLQFWLPKAGAAGRRARAEPQEGTAEEQAGEGMTRVLVHPGAVDPTRRGQARLVSPCAHEWAERVGPAGQSAHLERLLQEPWWREGVASAEVVLKRIPAEWGKVHYLWRDSMNPVMTASFMRHGRIPHRSPAVDGLFLCGASTHPGQWVSFCAISGVLAADAASAP